MAQSEDTEVPAGSRPGRAAFVNSWNDLMGVVSPESAVLMNAS
jgi:hypothetical protein